MESSKTIIRRLLPAAAALALFFVVSAVYFAPQFRGEVLPQHDVVQYDGMAKDINDMREATGEDPQWTGRMFGGMPAYLINVAYPAQLVKNTLGRVVKIIDTPAAFLFFAMTAMWLMLLIFGVNPWVGVVASLAYGLSTYFLLIIGAGHITKMWALVYAPLMMGGAWMTLRGNMWAGGALTALTASLEIGANHPQITYYFLLAMAAFWISEGVTAFREKHFRNFALRTAVLAAAGLLAVGSNFSPLWYTAKHSKETMRAYWGTQPYTGGPTYLGAAAIFLAALGVALVRGRNKWWIVAVSALTLLLAWGRNLMWFTELAFDWLPGYNKFRTVSMALVVVQWTVPLLGALALMRLWRDEIPRRRLFKALGWAAGVTGGLCLLLAVAGGSLFDFGREESAAMMTEQFHQILKANNMQEYLDRGMDAEMGIATADAMAAERASMMQADAWRSLLMILLAAGGVALFALRRINKYALTALLGAVMLLDLVPVDLRFLSHDDFISARRRQITATAADKAILADKDPGFRVLNLTVSPFQDATTSYFHRSVGGYHGAKLARYQDLIDRYLSYRNDAVLDMLNTRYLIVPGDDGQPQAVRRATANGPAWFVDGIVAADTPQQEIDLLGSVDLKTTAVAAPADKAFAEEWQAGGQADTTLVRGIALTEYRPNYQKYEYTAPEESVAVFSEIFYDHGWTAYVDGEAMPGFRADYILRAMKLPAGRHTVEWRFRAPGWAAAEAVTLVSSLLILLGAAAALIYCFRKKKA